MFAASKTASLSGYQIQRSLRFNSADSAYLNRTPSSAGNRQIFTLSCWVKRSALGAYSSLLTVGGSDVMWFTPSDAIEIASAGGALLTTAVYRDVSAWYHVVIAFDTPQATASNRIKLYVNGVQVTAFGTATYPAQNANSAFNSTSQHFIGAFPGTLYHFPGYMTEIYNIDGQALTPSSFGQTNANTGVWEPKPYAGTYGTNGFYLNFSDNSNTTATTLGKDYSGNGNNWTPNNFSVSAGAGNDSLVDVPTAWGTDTGVGGTVRGNYATWNSVLQTIGTANTYSNGNLVVSSTGNNWALGTVRINDGKYYFELTADSGVSGLYLGINNTTDVRIAAQSGGIQANTGGGSNQTGLATWSNGDIIGVAVDGVNKTVQFYRNGSTYGSQVTYTTSLDLWPFVRNAFDTSSQVTANFGQRPFAYTAPSGFKALCTQNLPTPTIGSTASTQAGKYFNAVTYTGNGSTNAITGVGFQPDLVWIKQRSQTRNHNLYDAVRGVLKVLQANVTDAEVNYSNSLTSFDSDGFSLGNASDPNTNAGTYVSWNWKANGAGVTNTAGSITSTVSANTTSGFSVVTFTGNGGTPSTVGHGLGSAPKFIIQKRRNDAGGWNCYHASLPVDYRIDLNTTAAATYDPGAWNATRPTSSVYSIQNPGNTNISGATYVAYCFAEVPGFSKFGSYTSNNSADGPFLYCGFRPAYVMIKNTTDPNASWIVYDNKRNTANVETNWLLPNASNAEGTDASLVMDFTSNGIKIRGNGLSINSASNSYIFAAFAEAPQKFALAR